MSEDSIRELLAQYRQEHLLAFWEELDDAGRAGLLEDIETIDFALMERLIEKWVRNDPPPESFDEIVPVPVISKDSPDRSEAEAVGEAALRAGRVGLFLVAGGQGTRLGFDGPKGSYPIGPVSKKSFFEFHAEKIHNLQNRYGCTLPWYIMVSHINEAATVAFFREHGFFGLKEQDVKFFKQRMVPCVDEHGKFMLAERGRVAKNPNGHGGSITAMSDNGVIADARARGVDTLSYFQIDNWTVKVADPVFIGYHLMNKAGMSSKNHRKRDMHEAVGVHCQCDGEYRVVEYTEMKIYEQLLAPDERGEPLFFAGNPAMHVVSIDFMASIFDNFDEFPWHRAHKKIAYIDAQGTLVKPVKPNAYKFETFIFDALRFIKHKPVVLEVDVAGEFSPVKTYDDEDSVQEAWQAMRMYWAEWLEAAGAQITREGDGDPSIRIEISPQFALTKEEFVAKTRDFEWPVDCDLALGPDGEFLQPGV